MVAISASETTMGVWSRRYQRVAHTLARLGLWLIVASITLSTLVGIVAIGAWPDAGEGPGGGWGVPGMVLLLAVGLGLPSAPLAVGGLVRGQWPQGRYLLAVAGPLLILVGFFFGSHLLDPCARGWLAPASESCEWAAGSWNVHPRYHLLYHALVPTAVLVAAYVALFQRWYPDRRRAR